ncbi:MAG: DNA-directed RNA polymerase subunit beta, partial [Alphaproteobacteria bacterium]|nr:DNA-directed RNA polymerase subunit beta [Alphaproteobacteria bacterium]
RGVKLNQNLINAETGDIVAEKETKITPRMAKKFQADGLKTVLVTEEDLYGLYIANDYIDEKSGEIFLEAGDELSKETLELTRTLKLNKLSVLHVDHINIGGYLRATLLADKKHSREDALLDIYRSIRPGEPPTLEGGEAIFTGLFFDEERYDLSAVGRVKLNARLGLEVEDTVRILLKSDIIAIIKTLLELKDGRGEVDDIDNLGN